MEEAREVALRAALERAEDRTEELQEFLDNAVEGLHRFGPDGRVLWANRAELDMFGYQREEYVGHPISEFHADPSVAADLLARLTRGEAIRNRQAMMRCRDGSLKFVLISSNGEFRDGRFRSSRCFTRELTDERDAYLAQARLAAIVDGSDDAILSKDLDGTVRSWNRGAQQLFGYKAEEMVGDSILRIIPPELHDEERDILARISLGERILHRETTRVRKDGSHVAVSLSVSPLRDISGRIIGASKIARDIGVQREAERAQGILAAIVRSSDDAIVSKNLDSVVSSWNPAAERLYGFTAAEMLGQPITRIIPAERQGEESFIVGEIRANRRISHFETERLRKDGTRVQVSLTVSPVRNAAGTVLGASQVARDVSAQHDARRRKDEFLAVLAHELRNPLAPIRTALALVRDAALPALQRDRALAIADRQMVQLTRLLEDLLDISRLSTGRVELKKERLDLAVLAAQSAESMRPYLEARRHRLRVTLPGEPLWIDGDAVRIHQVINNVISNAGKYTDPGGEVALRVAREDGAAVVRVSDTGIGFTSEMRQRLFVLFAQEKAAAGRLTGGLGIGLALVREFVERHGGTVDASSPGLGHGSEFVLRLPLAA